MVRGMRGDDCEHEESERCEDEVLKAEGENVGRIGIANIEEPAGRKYLQEVHFIEFFNV